MQNFEPLQTDQIFQQVGFHPWWGRVYVVSNFYPVELKSLKAKQQNYLNFDKFNLNLTKSALCTSNCLVVGLFNFPL